MLDYVLLIIGFALLYKGAGYLVDGSSSLAKKLGVSSLVIGLTIVSFGTSMPELVVNVYSAFKGTPDIAYGNIVGSNLFNTLLVLGIAAYIAPLKVQNSTVWKEIPFSLFAVLILAFMSNKVFFSNGTNNLLTRIDGIILLSFFTLFLFYAFKLAKQNKIKSKKQEKSKHEQHKNSMTIFFMLLGGFAMLFLGGKLTVDAAVNMARQFGISELLISSTVIAGGTSLPELFISIIALMKKEMDISVGNIIGSNIFNILFILGTTAVISPLVVPQGINFDLLILAISTILLFAFMFSGSKYNLDKWKGTALLALYAAYLAFIIYRG